MSFFLVFSFIYLASTYYIYRHIAGGLKLSGRASKILLLTFLVAALSFIPAEIVNRRFGAEWIRPIYYLSSVWLGVTAIAFSVFVIVDVSRLFIRIKKYRYYATISALVLIGLTSSYSLYNQAGRTVVKEIRIALPKLPPRLSGFTIVQLSDLHIDLSKSERWLKSLVAETLALHPDLIVITGDLIDTDICRLDGFCEILRGLKAKYGVYAVTGNHEYYTGIPLFMKIAANSNIEVLRNTNVLIAGVIELAGIDDAHEAEQFENISPKENLESALQKVDFRKPVILLSHQPDVFDLSRRMGVDLQLSGHTHAGQLPPMDLLVQILYEYPFGLYKRDTSYLYTTCGSAFWGPPMRLFTKSEIVKVSLEAEKS
jgi:predicted MPP superfamily phosphohydrolase